MKNRIIRCFSLNSCTNSIMASSIVFAIPVEVLSGVYMTENPKTILSKTVRTLTDHLLKIPTIVIGVIVCFWGSSTHVELFGTGKYHSFTSIMERYRSEGIVEGGLEFLFTQKKSKVSFCKLYITK